MPARDAEHARVLLARAGEDIAAMRELAGSDRIGHEIAWLTAIAQAERIEAPTTLDDAETLTPWALEPRYGEPPTDLLDREAAVRLAVALRDWAAREIDAAS